MSCRNCGANLVWRGSLGRGSYVCPMCHQSPERTKILARYGDEVLAWHRSWCKAVRQGKGKTDPKLCDCGHTEPCPYSEAQIEQRERAAYGEA